MYGESRDMVRVSFRNRFIVIKLDILSATVRQINVSKTLVSLDV